MKEAAIKALAELLASEQEKAGDALVAAGKAPAGSMSVMDHRNILDLHTARIGKVLACLQLITQLDGNDAQG